MRGLFLFFIFSVPIGVLVLLLLHSKTLAERLATALGMLLGFLGTFFLLLHLLPYGDGGGPIFSFLGAMLLGAPLGGWIGWSLARNASITS